MSPSVFASPDRSASQSRGAVCANAPMQPIQKSIYVPPSPYLMCGRRGQAKMLGWFFLPWAISIQYLCLATPATHQERGEGVHRFVSALDQTGPRLRLADRSGEASREGYKAGPLPMYPDSVTLVSGLFCAARRPHQPSRAETSQGPGAWLIP